jgi:hypothetical protein
MGHGWEHQSGARSDAAIMTIPGTQSTQFCGSGWFIDWEKLPFFAALAACLLLLRSYGPPIKFFQSSRLLIRR